MGKKVFLSLMMMLMFVLAATGANRRFVLVIDAGHGGHDSGALGTMSKEKNLTLSYALAFGKMVERNCPDVKVVYTRTTDIFLPLYQRAEIANKNKGDLFISIHINALTKNYTKQGFQSYTLGRGERSGDKGIRENLEVAKRENSVIFMEADYQRTYQSLNLNSAESDIMFEFIADNNRERSVELSRLMQREVCKATGRIDAGSHQNNLAVLRLTSMPSILLELGFISTPSEERFMVSESSLELYAKGMYNAFVLYKNKYDDRINVPYRDNRSNQPSRIIPVIPEETAVEKPAPVAEPEPRPMVNRPAIIEEPNIPAPTVTRQFDPAKPVFKVQIMVTSKKLANGDARFKKLMGYDYYEEDGLFKYTFGSSNDYNNIYSLRKQLLDRFPEAFIIAFKNGQKIDVNAGIREFKANR